MGLAIVVALAALLFRQADAVGGSVDRLRLPVAAAIRHLDEVLAANATGETQLHLAAASTGIERSTYLASSISSGEVSSQAWERYRSIALPLPGEQRLSARYERDYEAGKTIGGEVMIPIIRSQVPAPLPLRQLQLSEQERLDVLALRDLYVHEQDITLTALAHRMETARTRVRGGALLAFLLVLIGGTCALRTASRLLAGRETQAEAARLGEFESTLIRALELAEDDDTAMRVTARAMDEIQPDTATSILVSDASRVTFHPAVGASRCGIRNVDHCPAMRAGSPLQFGDDSSLDTCPALAEADGPACSVTCMPVSIGGRDEALVQLVGPVGRPPEMTGAVRLVVRRTGERITMMRAVARFELQASRDPLTGLFNRRRLEVAVDRLRKSARPYAVAFADLDRFKRLNDVHGHQAGDRALREFARNLVGSLRPEDISCRWGGEEFIVVLPGCGEQAAVDAMERVRASLAETAADGLAVTMSVGVAVGSDGEAFEQTVGRADSALRRAKATGRDRVVAWARPVPGDPPSRAARPRLVSSDDR